MRGALAFCRLLPTASLGFGEDFKPRALTRAGRQEAADIETCVAITPAIAPAAIKQLRESNKVSQPVFARYLNTSESTVEKRETGAKRPSGAALKLLSIVQKHGLQILA